MSSSSAARTGNGGDRSSSATGTLVSALSSAIGTASGSASTAKGHNAGSTTSSTAAASSTASSGGHGSSGGTTGNSAKSLQNYWYTYYPLFQWWLVAAAIGLVMLLYIGSLVRAYLPRHKAGRRDQPRSAEGETVGSREGTASWRNLPAAVSTVWNKVIYRWTFPTSFDRTQRMNLGEAFFCVGYVTAALVLGFIQSSSGPAVYGDLTGWLAYAQTPFVVGLAGKNNLISYLTGVSPEKLNVLHRTAGRTMLILSLAHTFAWVSLGVGPGTHHAINTPPMIWGTVATVALFVTTVLSFRMVRRLCYEFFLLSHIVLIFLFLLGCILHDKRGAYWLYPSFALWGADRLARIIRLILLNRLWLSVVPSSSKAYTKATIQAVSDMTIRITMKRKMTWNAGQHVYLVIPGVSRLPWEAHPFTVASSPPPSSPQKEDRDNIENELVFLVRARDGFTKRLMARAVSDGGESTVMAFVDGPYGLSPDLFQYSTVVLIAGGSGISYTLSQLSRILQCHPVTNSTIRRVSFVWVIRQTSHLEWVNESLASLVSAAPDGLDLDIKIFVTHTISAPSSMPLLISEATEKPVLTNKDSFSSVKSGISSEDTNGSPHPHLLRLTQVKMQDGRPDFSSLLKEEVDAAQGPLSVSVCGPSSLTQAVRTVLLKKEIASWGAALRGRPEVELHVEQFGW